MHGLRSILTTLGIVFGVCSVIAMLAIGEGASREAQAQIAQLGSQNIIIKTVKPPEGQEASGQGNTSLVYGLTYEDAERFRNTIPHVEVIVPIRRINQTAWYRNRKAAVEVIGTVPWHPEIAPIRLVSGRFLSSVDLNHQQSVCVIDELLVRSLFVLDGPLGQDVKIAGQYYRVIGIVSSPGPVEVNPGFGSNGSPANPNGGGVVGNIYIPLTSVKGRFGETTVQFNGSSQQIEKVELQEITIKVDSTDRVMATRDILEGLLDRSHKKKDYQVILPLELLRQAARTKRIFSIVLGSIAAISLLVGGIGIMNIMLATVSERTREIGIRRALGAKRRDIIVQFLSETVMLALTGGILGMLLGSLIPFLVTYFSKMPTVVTANSLVLSFGISGAIGIVFGLYPAYRAAHMDPIESLRHE
jgi:putative ABC transport system permease protein